MDNQEVEKENISNPTLAFYCINIILKYYFSYDEFALVVGLEARKRRKEEKNERKKETDNNAEEEVIEEDELKETEEKGGE